MISKAYQQHLIPHLIPDPLSEPFRWALREKFLTSDQAFVAKHHKPAILFKDHGQEMHILGAWPLGRSKRDPL